jgi:hypothetical protein
MENVNENKSFDKVLGLFAKGTTFIKPTGFVGGAKILKQSDDGLWEVDMPPVTASEQMFLDRHAN